MEQISVSAEPQQQYYPQAQSSNNTAISIVLLLVVLLVVFGGGYYWYTNYYMNAANMSPKRFKTLYKKCAAMIKKVDPTAKGPGFAPQMLDMTAMAAQKALKQLDWNLKPNEFCKLLMEKDTTPRGKQFTAVMMKNLMPGCTIM